MAQLVSDFDLAVKAITQKDISDTE